MKLALALFNFIDLPERARRLREVGLRGRESESQKVSDLLAPPQVKFFYQFDPVDLSMALQLDFCTKPFNFREDDCAPSSTIHESSQSHAAGEQGDAD